MRLARASLLASLLPVAASHGCAELSLLEAGVCGNFVVDRGEDCDGHAPEGAACAGAEEPNACRYVCSREREEPCPKGFGCGQDGVCRRSSGAYEALGDLLAIDARSLRSADFDGDGAPDILLLGEEDALGRRPARIVYPQSSSAGPLVVNLPIDIAAVSIGDIEGKDARADLVFAELEGISILRGRGDRTIDFAPFPKAQPPPKVQLRAAPIDAVSSLPGDELTMFVDGEGIGPLLVGVGPSGPLSALASFAEGVSALAADPLVGPFNQTSYCPQIVMPFLGASDVLLVQPCRQDAGEWGFNINAPPSAVALQQGATVDAPALAVDLDGDGSLDLLIGAGGAAFAAFGRGDGTFQSSPGGGGVIGQAGPYPLPAPGGVEIPFPFAARDLDGDGLLDYLVPRGLLISGGGEYTFAFSNAGDSWTHGAIGDFNGDGLLDVAAGTRDAINIDLLLNAGGSLFNPALIPTDGPTAHFTVADFDGDGVSDLAFSEELLVDEEESDAPAVLFGEFHRTPSSIVKLGALGELEQITSARLAGLTGSNGLSDLAVIARRRGATTDEILVFNGSTDRSLRAPLPLRNGDALFSPLTSATGQFATGEVTACVVGYDEGAKEIRLLNVRASDEVVYGSLSPSKAISPLFHTFAPGEGDFHVSVLAASGDLDGDGADEVVVIGPYGDSPQGAALVVASLLGSGATFIPSEEQPFEAEITQDSASALMDLDGDGALDLLITTGDEVAPSALVVIWNDGAGALLTEAPLSVALPGGVSAVACLPRTDAGCDLVTVSPGGTRRARFSGDRTYEVESFPGIPGGYGVTTGDFDKDGVFDIAIVSASGLHLFRGVPELL